MLKKDYLNILFNYIKKQNGKKIAIVGAGPAGMASTWYLIQQGYQIKIFEKSDKA